MFKKGDRVVRVSNKRGIYADGIHIKHGQVGTIKEIQDSTNVAFFKEHDYGAFLEDLILEDIYNSPLYQAMREK